SLTSFPITESTLSERSRRQRSRQTLLASHLLPHIYIRNFVLFLTTENINHPRFPVRLTFMQNCVEPQLRRLFTGRPVTAANRNGGFTACCKFISRTSYLSAELTLSESPPLRLAA
ncbi:hypothetical protein, partial [Flavobacterium agri]|uniref:hypothetical protein n=1 Tax=Flavobacterium agri TaxID=2743471 RepID=UPI001C37693D